MTVKCHRGEVLNEKSPHYAPKSVTALSVGQRVDLRL